MNGASGEIYEAEIIETGRAQWLELGDKFERIRSKVLSQAERRINRLRPRDDETMLTALFTYCEMHTWIQRPACLAFGWWFLERCPVATWTPDLAREMWTIWSAGQVAA
jgi:hypothetical protein